MEEIKQKIAILRNTIEKDLPENEKVITNALIDLAQIFLLDLHKLATK